MASAQFAIIAVFALVLPSIALATQYVVGDDNGWKPNVDYKAWTAGKVFRVGDTLLFKYTAGSHNVFKANQTEFQNCLKPDPKNALTSGHDEITLKTSGKHWYLCGFDGHCDKGQKLVVDVVDAWTAPAPAPTVPSPPASSAFASKASSAILAVAGVAATVALF